MAGGRKRQAGRRGKRPTAAERRRAAEAQAPLEPLVEDKAKGLRIKDRPVAELIPYARNARKHSDAQVAQIAGSIREFGFTAPVLTDGANGILAGHGRVLAAQRLKLAKVPTLDLAHLTEAQRRAYVLADNKLALNATWDKEMLAVEAGELQAMAADLNLVGFSDSELTDLLGADGGRKQGETDEDAAPAITKRAVSRPDDLWELGPHRLICGKAEDKAVVARVLADHAPHLMVTDQPYGVEYDAAWRAKQFKDGDRNTGKVQNDHQISWSQVWALFPGDVAYIWHADVWADVVIVDLRNLRFEPRSTLIWAKPGHVVGRGHYHWQHEACRYFVRKGKSGHWAGGRKQATVWSDIRPAGGEDDKTGHSTQKPVECMRRPMENNSKPGDAVYDPFMGSGTSLIAAETIGRVCLGVEIGPLYVDMAVRRWQAFTGQQARLAGDRRTFAEIEADRYDREDWREDARGSYDEAIAEQRAGLEAGGEESAGDDAGTETQADQSGGAGGQSG